MHLQRANLFLSHPPLCSPALLHDNRFHNPLPEPCRAKGQSRSWEKRASLSSLSLSQNTFLCLWKCSLLELWASSFHELLFTGKVAPYASYTVAAVAEKQKNKSLTVPLFCWFTAIFRGMTASQSIIPALRVNFHESYQNPKSNIFISLNMLSLSLSYIHATVLSNMETCLLHTTRCLSVCCCLSRWI